MKEFWLAVFAFLLICAIAGIINGIRFALRNPKPAKRHCTVDQEMDELGL